MTHFIRSFFLAFLICAAAPAAAEGTVIDRAAEIEKPKSFRVTSIKDCYDALTPEDAADIRMNYAMPYQECQKRLAARRQAQKIAEEKKAAADATPVTPRNFVRVKAPPPEAADAESSTPESEKSGASDAKKD